MLHINKPVVTIRGTGSIPRVNESVLVDPIDHPSSLVSNRGFAYTSPIIQITLDGFETLNTIYVPVATIESRNQEHHTPGFAD